MANNRLYIGNVDTGEFECISKSSDFFRKLKVQDLKRLNRIVITACGWDSKTPLKIFTENDDYWFDYFHKFNKES